MDRLLAEEAERVSRATKDWNALAEQIRRERFNVNVTEGAWACVTGCICWCVRA